RPFAGLAGRPGLAAETRGVVGLYASTRLLSTGPVCGIPSCGSHLHRGCTAIWGGKCCDSGEATDRNGPITSTIRSPDPPCHGGRLARSVSHPKQCGAPRVPE